MNNCFTVVGNKLLAGISHYAADERNYFINLGPELQNVSFRFPVWVSSPVIGIGGRIYSAGSRRNDQYVLDERVDPARNFFFLWNTQI